MTATAHYLPARYYALLCERLQEWGVDIAPLLQQAGVKPEVLNAVDGQLTAQQVELLGALAVQRVQRTDLGFELGRLMKISTHDILGYALLAAPTLDDGLRLVARYFSLLTPTYAMHYRRDAHSAEASFTPQLPLSPMMLNFHLEAIAVAYYEQVKTLLGGHAPSCHIYFSFPPPPHAARYHELSAATVHFSHETLPVARIRLDAGLAIQPLALADARTLHMAESRCASLLHTITSKARLADWTQMMLSQAAEGAPTLQELASILNLSPRTLERRLAAENTSFRSLSRAARHARACTLLGAGRLSVTQVAYQLGYTDVANFTRAFRREGGGVPSEYLRGLSTG